MEAGKWISDEAVRGSSEMVKENWKKSRGAGPEESGGEENDDGEKDRADEFRAILDDETGAEFGAEELADDHGGGEIEADLASGEEDDQRSGVAGEVHGFGVADGGAEVEAREEDAGEHPKGADAWAEEAIVEAEGGAREPSEEWRGDFRGTGGETELGLGPEVDGDGDEEPGDDLAKETWGTEEDGEGAEGGGEGGDEEGEAQAVPRKKPCATVVVGGDGGAADGLEFVCAEGDLGGESDGEEGGNGDQPAAAGDGVDEARGQARGGEEEGNLGIDHWGESGWIESKKRENRGREEKRLGKGGVDRLCWGDATAPWFSRFFS